jgi:hypothetical protein
LLPTLACSPSIVELEMHLHHLCFLMFILCFGKLRGLAIRDPKDGDDLPPKTLVGDDVHLVAELFELYVYVCVLCH